MNKKKIETSMLGKAKRLTSSFFGKSVFWECPYGLPQTEKILKKSSVWFTAYPLSTCAKPKQSILQTLADPKLWKAFKEIGIEGMHTSPLKRAGSLNGPSIDAGFDRIDFAIDEQFGTEKHYEQLTKIATQNKAVLIGDVIPGHTGKGIDFQLALERVDQYPGLYHLIQIPQKHWNLLPKIAPMNLSKKTVDLLTKKNLIIGPLEGTLFYKKGVKESNWSATPKIKCIDGLTRRYVYLHIFKEGQPSLNWIDPSFATHQMISGDIIHSLLHLGANGLRFDANSLLGEERNKDHPKGWLFGHPLSQTITQLLSMMIRKCGGFSFQELNLPVDEIKTSSSTDFSYDFVNRSAYVYAMLTHDTSFLKLTLNIMLEKKLHPKRLIHALQNHDEFVFDLIHFQKHEKEIFQLGSKKLTGKQLRTTIRQNAFSKAIYASEFNGGIATTTIGLICSGLKLNPHKLSDEEINLVKKAHLLLAMYNAWQPGVFALSGWDLVGALPQTTKNEDKRWINRRSYALLSDTKGCIYGDIGKQLKDPNSFARQLSKILKTRKKLSLHLAELLEVIPTKEKEILIQLFQLPNTKGFVLIALNFSPKKKSMTFSSPKWGEIPLNFAPFEGKALHLKK